MDANLNPDPKKPHPHDIAEAGPIDPATGQPDHQAEVSALKSWLRQNAVSLALTIAGVIAVCVFWDPITAAKVVLGLGFIIFIHELGHFLAAKACDVHVKTFSIGFGPAIPFCSYRWGETTYMLGVVPLGGYVSMVGEGTGESAPEGDPDDDDADPRSFKNKSVGQRMLIISAGVIMNVILGMACFVGAYLHGVREEPAIAGAVTPGAAAWRAGMRTGDNIVQIGDRKNPTFKDLPPAVMSTQKGELMPIVVDRNGTRIEMKVEPLREEGAYFPMLGIATVPRLTLVEAKKRAGTPWVVPGTPAAAAKDPAFEGGDRIVGMSDPADPAKVTPLPLDPRDPEHAAPSYDEYYRRMVELAGQPVTFQVLRKGEPAGAKPVEITVQPAFRHDLGLRMQMGKISAVRKDSPAEKAGIQAVPVDGPPTGPGDRIVRVRVTDAAGKGRWFVGDGKRPDEAKPNDDVKPLDPVMLPLELKRWAGEFPPDKRGNLSVDLVVLREVEHTEKPVPVTLPYDDSYRYERSVPLLPNSPLPVDGLGLAYWVGAVVNEVVPGSAAAEAGVRSMDQITAVRFAGLATDGTVKDGEWTELKAHEWASVEAGFQQAPPYRVGLKVKQGDGEKEVTLEGRPDAAWGLPERGLRFEVDYREQKAADVGDAIGLGAYRTVRFIKQVYQNLYAMLRGRVSPRTMSGPLTIASVSYKIAGEDFWQFLLFLGLISVNLAVVNFLPIPVLDGGHMVFLLIEKALGRPVPERLFAVAMYVGLALILCLFLYVITLDVRRLFFGLF